MALLNIGLYRLHPNLYLCHYFATVPHPDNAELTNFLLHRNKLACGEPEKTLVQ